MGAMRHAFGFINSTVNASIRSGSELFRHLTYNVHLHSPCACNRTALAAGVVWLCSSPNSTELHVPEVECSPLIYLRERPTNFQPAAMEWTSQYRIPIQS